MDGALFYEKSGKDILCLLCPHTCRIAAGETGFCRVRKNENGKLVLPYYGAVSSIALDPVEKKPFCRFYPGKAILSVGGYGCNMRCTWCQNHTISMSVPDNTKGNFYSASYLAELSTNLTDNIGLAYTYNEPLIHYEFIYDTCKAHSRTGLKNALITNGMINKEPLLKLLPFIHAMNIDLKGTETLYEEARGIFRAVKQTIEISSEKCHVEVTCLIIPGLNDEAEFMENISAFLADIDTNIPLHLTKFYPRYKMRDRRAATPDDTARLKDIAAKRLKYVYG